MSTSVATRKRRRIPLVDRIALIICGLVLAIAVIGPWIAPHDPYAVNLSQRLLGPGPEHWLGTDINGRDVLSRILTGARTTLLATAVVLAVTVVIGVVVGTLAAVGGRVVDEIIMRITDVGLAVPSIVLALGFAVALGPGIGSAIIAVSVSWWPGYVRLIRTVVRETMQSEFVESAVALGVGRRRLILRHVLPNSLDILYVQVTLDVAAVMLVISGLSFIGVGAQVPSAEWGAMIAAAADNVTSGWWALVFPGLAIAITAIAFSLVGDWLRVLRDPTLKQEN
ncbi:ABC transporter permease [Kineosporia babensis]|uniref:ABC transporter permease n=1 Tax=Kineosporia babensis TaxID=499548 RepID=A0A9X1SY63_9ACTN|nr:ABC transporter permease [Kineosporia babensis]MCD5310738.1 ABC transporter permease [Kineosporia babensis]